MYQANHHVEQEQKQKKPEHIEKRQRDIPEYAPPKRRRLAHGRPSFQNTEDCAAHEANH